MTIHSSLSENERNTENDSKDSLVYTYNNNNNNNVRWHSENSIYRPETRAATVTKKQQCFC